MLADPHWNITTGRPYLFFSGLHLIRYNIVLQNDLCLARNKINTTYLEKKIIISIIEEYIK